MCTGSTRKARAMVGSAVAITVESRFCMNNAVATISAVSRVVGLVPDRAAPRSARGRLMRAASSRVAALRRSAAAPLPCVASAGGAGDDERPEPLRLRPLIGGLPEQADADRYVQRRVA